MKEEEAEGNNAYVPDPFRTIKDLLNAYVNVMLLGGVGHPGAIDTFFIWKKVNIPTQGRPFCVENGKISGQV